MRKTLGWTKNETNVHVKKARRIKTVNLGADLQGVSRETLVHVNNTYFHQIMALFRALRWALISILRLRFSSGSSLAIR